MRSRKEQQEQREKERIICIHDNVFVECFGCRWLCELWLLLNISDSFKEADLQHCCFRKQAAANGDWGKLSLQLATRNHLAQTSDHLHVHIYSQSLLQCIQGVLCELKPWHLFPFSSSLVSLYSKSVSGSVFLNYWCGAAAPLGTTGKERMSPEVLWEK